eukprot:2158727-Amphidinium_carterae.1
MELTEGQMSQIEAMTALLLEALPAKQLRLWFLVSTWTNARSACGQLCESTIADHNRTVAGMPWLNNDTRVNIKWSSTVRMMWNKTSAITIRVKTHGCNRSSAHSL